MIPKHDNPTKKRNDGSWAYAPYNFVPLPEKVVFVDSIPPQDIYTDNTGYIECLMTTESPFYTRCGMKDLYLFSWDDVSGNDSKKVLSFLKDICDVNWSENAKINKSNDGEAILISKDENSAKIIINEIEEKATLTINDGRSYDLKLKKEIGKLNIYLDFFSEFGEMSFDKLPEKIKKERAQFFHLTDEKYPLIPGSSLRGMVRSLVEIAGYGKVQWVTDDTKISYRAVAVPKDPLAEPYMEVLGEYGCNVQAGYLVNKRDDWYIHPAKKAFDLNLQGSESFLKIKEKIIPLNAIPDFIDMNDKNYKPQYHEVSFNAIMQMGKHGKYNKITAIGSINAGYKYQGVLVCSGNMLETDSNSSPSLSPRKNHVLVLEKTDAKKLKISEQAIINYKAALTPFQKEPPFDERMGCLKNGRPIFYIPDTTGKEVLYFGHSPNFRIPAIISEDKCITSPMNFVPKYLQSENVTDLAEAIFGYIDKKEMPARAGRVFFTDAKYKSARNGIWLTQEPFTPSILASPKPTTFQHYLVQDREKGHDPDNRGTLAHYATPSPGETVIRGCKMYWHKGNISRKDVEADPENARKYHTQHTRIKPVNAGVTFTFRIYFENLCEIELGALLWVLTLPGEEGKQYRHKLGMGKPHGMGTVRIEPKLYLSDRIKRYERLFDANGWAEPPVDDGDPEWCVKLFGDYVLDSLRLGNNKLKDVERIKMLLKMLEWPGPKPKKTRYLESMPQSEYKERPVLPDPLNV